jgi:hypothetical protein
MYMLMHVAKKTEAEDPTVSPYLRRRVIVELTLSELPLLEEAERLHGTKRQAIVKALEGASRSNDLELRLAEAKEELARLGTELASVRADHAASEKASERMARELKKAREALAGAQKSSASSSKESDRRLRELERLLDERDREIRDLEGRIFDDLFCGRCGKWVSPEDFGWTEEEGGAYAFHRSCGNHEPKVMKPSSWLGWQSV